MATDEDIGVHPRVNKRHPEITDADVKAAMKSMFCYRQRLSGEWVAVGIDGNSRMLELVYEYDSEEDFFFVYHAQLPPSGKTLKELGLER